MQLNLETTDISNAADAGFEFQLIAPDGSALEGWITVRGIDSEAYEAAQTEIERAWREELQRTRRALTSQEQEERATQLLIAATVSWRGPFFETSKGPVACTPNEMRRIYSHRGWRWIREQVDRKIHDRANFLPRAATPS